MAHGPDPRNRHTVAAAEHMDILSQEQFLIDPNPAKVRSSEKAIKRCVFPSGRRFALLPPGHQSHLLAHRYAHIENTGRLCQKSRNQPLQVSMVPMHDFPQKLAVLPVRANASEYLHRCLINLAHLGHLGTLLVVVTLVDTDSIHPDVPAIVMLTCLLQSMYAVRSDIHSSAVEKNREDRCHSTPCV